MLHFMACVKYAVWKWVIIPKTYPPTMYSLHILFIQDEINKYLSYQECGERKTTITHETSFVKLLSHAENGEEEGGLLFSVIVDIVSILP